MKPEIDWLQQHDLSILPHQEVDWLEYKGRKVIDLTLGVDENSAKDTLSKAVTAMANSGGGYLILGIDDKTYQVDDGGIDLLIKPCGTRVWLEDIIPTLTDPPLIGFNVIERISKDITEIDDQNRAIYIIDIPDSVHAPHQAKDNKYYGRIGGKSKPLSHQFVKDIMGRRVKAQISLNFVLVSENEKLFLYLLIENNGRVMASNVRGWLRIPKYLIPSDYLQNAWIEEIEHIPYYVKEFDNTVQDITGIDSNTGLNYGIRRTIPILRDVDFIVKQELERRPFELQTAFIKNNKVLWEYAVDNEPMEEGEIEFFQIRNQSKKFDI